MDRARRAELLAVAAAAAVLGGAAVACTQRALERPETGAAEPAFTADEQNNIDVYRAASPGVVNITSRSFVEGFFGVFPQEGTGSGSIIDAKGHILTNYHVVKGATQLEVQVEDEKYQGAIVGLDRDNDLAIIKIDAPPDKLTAVRLGTSKGLKVGQKVLAIGNPFGLQRTMTTGIISGLERPLRDAAARRTIEGAIQTDASINPGNSGGPLLDTHGELIGINTAIVSPSGGSVGVGFAVPVDVAKRIIPDLIEKGHVTYPWLGITAVPLDRRIVRAFRLPIERGLVVAEVSRGSGAAAAGLRGATVRESMLGGLVLERLGDVIISVDGQPVASGDDLARAIKDRKPGDSVTVQLLRGDRSLKLAVELSERPPDSDD